MPTARKPYSQPQRSAMAGSVSAAMIPLTLIAVWFTPIAVARSVTGNQRTTARTADG